MSRTVLSALALVISSALPAFSNDAKIMISDAYARSSAKSGAAFFSIMNHSDVDDRLVSATFDGAKRVELHTHIMEDGIAKMREVEGGFPVAAGETHMLLRGGDHVMLMGLNAPLPQGETISLTLTFEQSGDVTVEIPVDNDRKGPAKMHGDHSAHSH